ncbi:MAG: hypothetical protein HRF40_11960 [Nitrososphaera sp.]|jgi:hypothetical protein
MITAIKTVYLVQSAVGNSRGAAGPFAISSMIYLLHMKEEGAQVSWDITLLKSLRPLCSYTG